MWMGVAWGGEPGKPGKPGAQFDVHPVLDPLPRVGGEHLYCSMPLQPGARDTGADSSTERVASHDERVASRGSVSALVADDNFCNEAAAPLMQPPCIQAAAARRSVGEQIGLGAVDVSTSVQKMMNGQSPQRQASWGST